MRVLSIVLLILLTGTGAGAVEVAGVRLPAVVTLENDELKLNGYGVRKRMIFDIYIGSLYTAASVRSFQEAVNEPAGKIIRMDFLHRRVGKQNIVEAFEAGLRNNSPEMAAQADTVAFLDWFTQDFVRGDQVELRLLRDGTITALQNGTVLGSLRNPELAKGILGIYLGHTPADPSLKRGMLGL
ncbi:hypothetical protein Selin_1404 [Desulfurispirillum indicum S5]|uniref:Chalcone isomerase domain-containing protein n=1 Tax=Desulfurispirillum indicum (strain ATCC BAA-1389 / DSM 22839 / S5) TaxID=653733 RepID=E6W6A3_DESIS|nr:chalcone isomerase family protein [Desulfurispirillum indicum]ADU66139.1 hypothetical protein Selin_1404 [Desulfurispirillum indicum S5]